MVPAATKTHRRPDEDFPRQQGSEPAGRLWPDCTDLQQAGHRACDLRESVVHTVEEQNRPRQERTEGHSVRPSPYHRGNRRQCR